MWATSFSWQPFSFLQPFSFWQPVSFLQQSSLQPFSFLQRLFSWRVFFSLLLAWHPPYDGFLIGSLKLPALRNPCSTCCIVSYYNIQHIVGQWFYVNNQKKISGCKTLKKPRPGVNASNRSPSNIAVSQGSRLNFHSRLFFVCSVTRRISLGRQRRIRGPHVPVPRETRTGIPPTSYCPASSG